MLPSSCLRPAAVQRTMGQSPIKYVHKLNNLCNKIYKLWLFVIEKIDELYKLAKKIIKTSLYRKTCGEEYTAHFKQPSASEKNLIRLMESFTDYSLTSQAYYHSNPITEKQKNIINNKIKNNENNSERCSDFLKRSKKPNFTLQECRGEDLHILDQVTFEQNNSFCGDLVELFNTKHFDYLKNDLEKQFSFDYYEAVVAEVLARSIAYNTSLDGEIIKLPVKNKWGEYKAANYTIKSYFLGDSLPTYILECLKKDNTDKHSPWFVVRGTETNIAKTSDGERARTGIFESFCADTIHPDGIAQGIVNSNLNVGKIVTKNKQSVLQKSLREIFANRQFKLSGHSLGGTIVNEMTAKLYENVEKAYAYSAPGVSERVATIWEENKMNNSKLINIQVQGDAVPAAGKRLIGTQLAFTHLIKPKKTDPIHLHVLMCLTKPFKLQQIHKEKEHGRVGRKAIEQLRCFVGSINLFVASKLKWQLPDWYNNRDLYSDEVQHSLV